LPSLFETSCRLRTSATALRRAGNQTRALSILAGTETSISFLFFNVSRAFPCGRGDTRRAALRSFVRAPVKVAPGYPGLPNRDARSNAPPPRLAPAEHSEDQRARVEGPSEGRVPWRMRRSLVPAPGACALCAHADGVPLLGVLRTSAVIGARPAVGGYPRQSADRPRPSFQRPPAKGTVFQTTRMPFTVTPREGFIVREGNNPSGLRAGSLAHAAPTFSPGWGEWFLMGIARSRCGHPRIRDRLESADTFITRWDFRAWD